MRRLIHTVFAVFAATTILVAQQEPDPKDALTGTLSAKSSVASSDQAVDLVVSFETSVDCTVPQTMLTGHVVEAWVGEAKRFEFVDEKPGRVSLSKGTRISRTVSVDLKLVFGGDTAAEGPSAVTFRWPGLAGAETRVQVIPDQASIDLDKLDYAKTHVKLVTVMGDIEIEFFPDKAPNHVKNFIKLAKEGFYNNTQFHRVIRGFMAQGGCPNTKPGATGRPGTGDPGYKIDAEFNDVKHVRGIVSAARSADPNSAGSQFFLMHGEAPHLDGQYTAYGRIVDGLEVLDKIASTQVGGPQRSTPVEPMHLYAAIVLPVYKQE